MTENMLTLKRFLYKSALKPIFFKFDPEAVHDLVTMVGEFLGRFRSTRALVRSLFYYEHSSLKQKLWGIDFENPVGLAAGFDKDGKLYSVIGSVGFGFTEVGTVTYGVYEGNPKPRLYRLPQSKGLVVYYGLKNEGAANIVKRLQTRSKNIPQIISIGRTNVAETASLERGIKDYFDCFQYFIKNRVGDIYEINISCPNLFCGESFNEVPYLKLLLEKLFSLPIENPVFVKMPINLDWENFKKLLDVILQFNVSAVVIGNLNKDRTSQAIKEQIPQNIKGSVSGKPTQELSNELISKTYQYCGGKLKIIGVGGIFSAEDAYEKIRRGASMVELITGMIYEGPQLVGEINKNLAELLKRDGYKNINEAVGTLA